MLQCVFKVGIIHRKEKLYDCVIKHAEGSTINYNGVRDSYEDKGLVLVMVGGMVLLRKRTQTADCM